MKKVLITNGYSDSNKGDLAITLATIKSIRELLPESEIVLQSVYSKKDPDFSFHNRFINPHIDRLEEMVIPSPYITTEAANGWGNLQALSRLALSLFTMMCYVLRLGGLTKRINREQYNSLETFFNADVVIMKGGQYIYNDQGAIRGGIYLFRMLIPLLMRKDLIILSQSIGPINGFFAKKLSKFALSRAKVILPREENSEEFIVKELGVSSHIKIIPDMAFYFSDCHIKDPKSRYLGITVVNWYFPDKPNPLKAREDYAEAMAKAISSLSLTHSLEIKFIPQVTVKHHGESDLDMIDAIVRKLSSEVKFSILDKDLSIEQIINEYKSCKILIGTRLHSCILAACVATPVLAIRYQGYKTQGIMSSLGLSKYVLDINTIKEEEIYTLAEDLIENGDVISKQISEKTGSKRDEIIGELSKLLH